MYYKKYRKIDLYVLLILLLNILPMKNIYCDSNSKKYLNESIEILKNIEWKYGETFIMEVNKVKVTKEEKELMKIAEEYCSDDDLFSTNTLSQLKDPKKLCYKVYEYYRDTLYYKHCNNTGSSLLKISYKVDMKFIGEFIENNIKYQDVYIVTMFLGVEIGEDISGISDGSGGGFGIKRLVWIQKHTKKVIKVMDIQHIEYSYD